MPLKDNEEGEIAVPDLVFAPREGGYAKGEDTRHDILHAALTILIEQGYRAMSMRRVAGSCGMKLGNLTYHFPTREDLVRELLDAVISGYELAFDEIVHKPGTSPETRLANICRFILEDIRTKKTTHLFPELWALSNHDPFVLGRVQDLYRRARAPLVEIVSEMRPDLPEDDRHAVALFISASIEGTTPFAGFAKPFEPIMGKLEDIAMHAFMQLVTTYKSSAAS